MKLIKGTLKQLCEALPPPLPPRAKQIPKPAGSNTDWSWLEGNKEDQQSVGGDLASVVHNAELAQSVVSKIVAAAKSGDKASVQKQLTTLQFYVDAVKDSLAK